MCVGSGACADAGAQGRAERAPERDAPALVLASTVSGHDGGGHHGQRGRDECDGEGGGDPPALSLCPHPEEQPERDPSAVVRTQQ